MAAVAPFSGSAASARKVPTIASILSTSSELQCASEAPDEGAGIVAASAAVAVATLPCYPGTGICKLT